MAHGVGEVIAQLIDKHDEEIAKLAKQLHLNKLMYKNNLKIVCDERNVARQNLKVVSNENKEKDKRNQMLEKNLQKKESEEKRLKEDANRWRKYLTLETKKNAELKAKQNVQVSNSKPGIPYDDLTNRPTMKDRITKSVNTLQEISGQSNSRFFYRHIFDDLDRTGLQKTKFTPYEGFQLYYDLNLTRDGYEKMKQWFRKYHMYDPFPSMHSIKLIENEVADKTMYTVSNKVVEDADGKTKTVTYAYLNNIQQFVNDRVQCLIDSGKLKFDNATGDSIWLTIMGDKGGDETKLCLSIGNVEKPNSFAHLIPLGMYNDDETASKMMEFLEPAINQINCLKQVNVVINDEDVAIPVKQYLAGDLKFLYACLGHQGASSACSCMFCYSQGRQKIKDYVRGKDCVLRTELSYAFDRLKEGQERKNVKEDGTYLFPSVPLSRVTPASLHICMGLGQTYGFTPLKLLADEQDCILNEELPTATQKNKKQAKQELDLANKSFIDSENTLKSIGDVRTALENHYLKKIDETMLNEDECGSEFCLFRDQSMVNNTYYDSRIVQCMQCGEKVHAVCCGLWGEQEWKKSKLTGTIPQCFQCRGWRIARIRESCRGAMEILKNDRDVKHNNLGITQGKYDEKMALWSGQGKTRKELEKIWKKHGADISAYKQDFCGNHMLKLLQKDAIEDYFSIFDQTPKLLHMKQFLLTLGHFQSLCVAREMSLNEMDDMERSINSLWHILQQYAGESNVTPKLHVLLEHTMTFVRFHNTLAKTSEQGIEAMHSALNRIKIRFRNDRNDLRKTNFAFRYLLFNNHISDVC